MIKNQIIKNIQKQMKPILNQNQYLNLTQTLKKRTNIFTNHTWKQQPPPLNNETPLEQFLLAKTVEGCSKKNKENSTSTTNQHKNQNKKKHENQKVSWRHCYIF